MKKIKKNKFDKESKIVYKEAFPTFERVPIFVLNKLLKQNRLMLYKYYDEDTFVGFAIVGIYQNLCYVFFLVIDKHYRSQGYGSKILDDLKIECGDKKIILAVEYSPKGDTSIKAKRVAFYKKNDFVDTNIKLKEVNVTYSILCFNGMATFEEYKDAMFYCVGKFYARKILNIRKIK